MIDTISDAVEIVIILIKERLGVEELAVVIMNFDNVVIEKYDEMDGALYRRESYTYAVKKLDLDVKNRTTPTTHPSIEQPPVLELMALLSRLYYTFLGANNTLLMIIFANLLETEVEAFLSVL